MKGVGKAHTQTVRLWTRFTPLKVDCCPCYLCRPQQAKVLCRSVSVRLSMCPQHCVSVQRAAALHIARRISLSSEGNALYPVLSSFRYAAKDS